MLTLLAMVVLGQFPIIMESSPVIYEMPVMSTPVYASYSYLPVIRSAPVVSYSFPTTYYMRASPVVSVYSAPIFGSSGTVITRQRSLFGLRDRTMIQNW